MKTKKKQNPQDGLFCQGGGEVWDQVELCGVNLKGYCPLETLKSLLHVNNFKASVQVFGQEGKKGREIIMNSPNDSQ